MNDVEIKRYALFSNFPMPGMCMVIIRGNNTNTAQSWGGFISWVGGIKYE